MSIEESDVVVGNCYRKGDQHRRVICITNDNKVIYESWGGIVGNFKDQLNRPTPPSLENFAKDVDEAIECPDGMKSLEDVQKQCKCNSKKSDNTETDSITDQ
jgi:hypothetical protein